MSSSGNWFIQHGLAFDSLYIMLTTLAEAECSPARFLSFFPFSGERRLGQVSRLRRTRLGQKIGQRKSGRRGSTSVNLERPGDGGRASKGWRVEIQKLFEAITARFEKHFLFSFRSF